MAQAGDRVSVLELSGEAIGGGVKAQAGNGADSCGDDVGGEAIDGSVVAQACDGVGGGDFSVGGEAIGGRYHVLESIQKYLLPRLCKFDKRTL